MAFAFLSDEWISEARKIREGSESTPPLVHTFKMNLVVTDVPFGSGDIDAHIDTSSGELDLDKGHIDDPDLTVTVDYSTAKAMVVDANFQAGMQAYMSGTIQAVGDISKVMALQSSGSDPSAQELASRIREMTS